MSTCVDLVEGNDSMNSYEHLYIIQGNIKSQLDSGYGYQSSLGFSQQIRLHS
jgi:hypothetical protein